MSKYDQFTEFLTQSDRDKIQMTFEEIETVLGFSLPKSKSYPAWWSNNPANNTMTNAWIAAGYKTRDVNIKSGMLTFVRQTENGDATRPSSNLTTKVNSPLFGSMRGTTIVSEGVDLTEPADPNWAKVYDEQNDPVSSEIEAIRNSSSLSISEKIRALAVIGVSRADIACTLGKRYQHVRNVLVDAQRKAG